jgi:hypothetical protein
MQTERTSRKSLEHRQTTRRRAGTVGKIVGVTVALSLRVHASPRCRTKKVLRRFFHDSLLRESCEKNRCK